jgi:glycosyltransferase involved in cell wall biosynthesis
MMKRLKVLVSAYACNPTKGSEEGVGWGWVHAIAQYHETHVIVACYHRKDIEKAINECPGSFKNIYFYYVPHKLFHYKPSKFWIFIENSSLKPLMNSAYRLWQKDEFNIAQQLHKKIKFDLIHQLTYVGFRFPGHLWEINVPFIWGPIGGLENIPWRFLPMLGFKGCFYFGFRNIFNILDKAFRRNPRKAFTRAKGGIIAATGGIRKEILRWYGEDSEVICEIGPPSFAAEHHSFKQTDEPLKISWSGQHTPGKSLPLLLRSLAKLYDIPWQLDILGNGPCKKKWQKLTTDLSINDSCHWHGYLPRSKAIQLVQQSHVFVITSMKDLTSTVLLEALSQGVPVICPDHCGFSDVVTDDCGIKLSVLSPDQLELDLMKAIKWLAENEGERRRLAKGAMIRSQDFSWEKKAKQINMIYQKAITKGNF